MQSSAWIVEGLVPSQGIVRLVGPQGAGKSRLAVLIAYVVAKGIPLFGQFATRQGVAVYMSLEHPMDSVWPRIEPMRRVLGSLGLEFFRAGAPPNPPGWVNVGELSEALAKHEPDLLVIDTARLLRPAGSDGALAHDGEHRHTVEALAEYAREHHCAVVLVDHAVGDTLAQELATAPCDTILSMTGKGGRRAGAMLSVMGRETGDMTLELRADPVWGWRCIDCRRESTAEGDRLRMLHAIDATIGEDGWSRLGTIARATGVNYHRTDRMLRSMRRQGLLAAARRGRYRRVAPGRLSQDTVAA